VRLRSQRCRLLKARLRTSETRNNGRVPDNAKTMKVTRDASKSAAMVFGCLLAACHTHRIEPVPIMGTVPESILILPVGPQAGAADLDLASLTFGLDQALAQRGYRALPGGVAAPVRVQDGVPVAEDLLGLRREFAADAVMTLDVEHWFFRSEPPARAEWSLVWRLWSTSGEGVIWTHRGSGTSAPAPDSSLGVLDRPHEEGAVKPFGSEKPQWFTSTSDLAASLHRLAMAYLPRRAE
jgi:hypothetical protein